MGYRQPLPDKEITIGIVWTVKEYDQDNDDDDGGDKWCGRIRIPLELTTMSKEVNHLKNSRSNEI